MKSSARSCLRAVFRQGSDYAGSAGLSQQLVKRRACKDGGRPVRYTGSVTKLRRPRRKTNREIEVKLPVDDVLELVRRLRQIGATNHGRVLEQNTLYDTRASDFRLLGRLLRLRVETPPNGKRRALMTSKAPAPLERLGAARSRYKERLEREVLVRDPIRADRLLRSLGLRPGFRPTSCHRSRCSPARICAARLYSTDILGCERRRLPPQGSQAGEYALRKKKSA
jgi:hypothetical protein